MMRARATNSLIAFAVAATFLVPTSTLAVKSVGDLKDVESQVQDLVSRSLPATVCIRSARGPGSGSGVIVSADGLVLTAAHVTMAAGEALVVVFPDGREVKAKSLGGNRIRDAGMVQITEEGTYPFVEMGKSADLKKNDWCISLGHAGGFQKDRSPPVRLGRILSNDRYVVTDCTIIGGDSGGPLFDLNGRLVGIHSNIGESLSQNQHVPIDVFTEDWERMKNGETWGRLGGGQRMNPRQPVMGVELSQEPSKDGVALGGITPDSPAEKAGLKVNDVITKINGKRVRTANELIRLVSGKRAGDELNLKVKRGDKLLSLDVKLVRAGQLMQRNRSQQRRRRPPEDDSDDAGKKSGDKSSKDESQKDADETDDAKKVDADSEGKSTDKKSDAKERSVDELMREARKNGGRLELSEDERQRLRKFMLERVGQLGNRQPVDIAPDEWYLSVMKAYEPVVAIASDSTYRVLVDGKQVALGTAVSPNTLLTKASEIKEQDFEIEVDKDQLVEGELLKVFKAYDLALVQVADVTVKPAKFRSKKTELPLGTFLAAVGVAKEPSAIGLMSVKTRELEAGKGFLGVSLFDDEAGVGIEEVMPRSPAKKAGLKVNDVIIKLDGKKCGELLELIKAVGARQPDEEITLLVLRDEKEITISVKLGIRTADPRSRIEMMNRMGSELSDTRSGFPMALQHDCPIQPNACGGPLVNLDGEVVGINIARAGRIKSYALPAHVIQELVPSEATKQLQTQ